MPLHSIQPLPGGAVLGRWHLTEAAPADFWPLLGAAAPAYAPLLPARAQGPRQAQWLAGRVLVARMLAAAGAPPALLQNDPHGRPYLAGPGPPPAVSLSHAGEWVLALLAPPGRAVGIDVEAVRDKAWRIRHKFLNDAELAAAQHLLPAAADAPWLYSLLWSAKETLFKLGGRQGIIFRENLLLDLPAALPATGPGAALAARLRLPTSPETRHQICISEPAPGYVLTYCVG